MFVVERNHKRPHSCEVRSVFLLRTVTKLRPTVASVFLWRCVAWQSID